MTTMTIRIACVVIALIGLPMAGCSKVPSERDLLDSFAAQLAANPAAKHFARHGDDLSFTGPGSDGLKTAQWRVHLDSAVIEPTADAGSPYKGTVKSSWYSDDQLVPPSADGRRSNLPAALTANGLAQDCWANWDPEARTWGWE